MGARCFSLRTQLYFFCGWVNRTIFLITVIKRYRPVRFRFLLFLRFLLLSRFLLLFLCIDFCFPLSLSWPGCRPSLAFRFLRLFMSIDVWFPLSLSLPACRASHDGQTYRFLSRHGRQKKYKRVPLVHNQLKSNLTKVFHEWWENFYPEGEKSFNLSLSSAEYFKTFCRPLAKI